MPATDPTGTSWTDSEIDLIVADYFEMLKFELSNEPYVKAHRNNALQKHIRRSRGSIEYKHQNISAVLLKLGLPWIAGYKPMPNFQGALLDGINRYLTGQDFLAVISDSATLSGLSERPELFLHPPPALSGKEPPDPEALKRLVRKFDPAMRDARNRKLGQLGEELIFQFERSQLQSIGRPDLAQSVRWISKEEGDGAGFDILSFSPKGEERLLEVKTTTGGQLTPFYLSENERSLSTEKIDKFHLVRVYDFVKQPKAFTLRPPLEESVLLQPTNYRASFGAR